MDEHVNKALIGAYDERYVRLVLESYLRLSYHALSIRT